MSVVELGLLINIDMWFLLPDDQQIANEGWFCRYKSKNKVTELFDCLKNCDIEYKESTDSIFLRKLIEDTSILKVTKIRK